MKVARARPFVGRHCGHEDMFLPWRNRRVLSAVTALSQRVLYQAAPATAPIPLCIGRVQNIFSSTKLLAEADTSLTPVASPLSSALLSNIKTSEKSALVKPEKVQAVLKGIRQSPKKVNLVAELVRGMRVEDALLQLQVTVKRAAKTVYKVIKSARANASNNHGLDPDRLIVAEAFVGKGMYLKRLSYHAKGRCGIMVRPHCRLTVVVREITAEEEAKIAKIKVMNYKKLTRKERQLVPHKLIETTPRWSRRSKMSDPGNKVEA